MLYEILRNLLFKLGGITALTRFMGIEKVDARRLVVFGLLIAFLIFLLVWSYLANVAQGA